MKDIALHTLDLLQNSISAGAKIMEVMISEDPISDRYQYSIQDNGKGISPDMLPKVKDPYSTSRTTRKVGLGIPLLVLNAQAADGDVEIFSELGKGTLLKAWFRYSHIDRIPLGDMAGVMVMSAAMNPNLDFIYKHITPKGTFIFDTREVKEALDGIPINEPAAQVYVKEYILENLKEIL